jgi:hypothetical protein
MGRRSEEGRPLPVHELVDDSLPSVIPASLHVTLAFGQERVRAELVNRLGAAVREGAGRFAVVVAGAPVDPDLLVVDPIRVPAPSELDVAGLPAAAEVCFVARCLSTPAEAQAINALARSAGPRIVPLLVDDVVAADWSLCGR